MDNKLPYYMTYPMPLLYNDERIDDRDIEYMKSLYPREAKRLLPYVEEECDRMEYEGSMLYDEYPDRLQLYIMCGHVYDKARDDEGMKMQNPEYEEDGPGQEDDSGVKMQQKRRQDSHLWDLIQVLLFQEMHKRRREHRRHKRTFY